MPSTPELSLLDLDRLPLLREMRCEKREPRWLSFDPTRLLRSAEGSRVVLGGVERARSLCPGSRFCQVYGWSDAGAIPSELPLGGDARRQLRFSYLAPRNGNAEAIYFDCRLFAETAGGRCLPSARP